MEILASGSVAPDFSLDSTPDHIPSNHSPRFLPVLHWTLNQAWNGRRARGRRPDWTR